MSVELSGDRPFENRPSIEAKALRINLNEHIYGTFAEIGAGQEVARHFLELEEPQEQLQKQLVHMTRVLVIIFMEKKMMEDMLLRLDYKKCLIEK